MSVHEPSETPDSDVIYFLMVAALREFHNVSSDFEKKVSELREWNSEALAENNKYDKQSDIFCYALREICANDKKKAKELRAIARQALLDAAIINEEAKQ